MPLHTFLWRVRRFGPLRWYHGKHMLQECYGIAHIKPKHHWLMHIPSQLEKHQAILDAFVVERQHLLVKVCEVSCNV